jgi:hypothetical protein
MKATKIFYKKLIGLGNFENEQIGIELEIGDGETAEQVLEQAKRFVNGKKESENQDYNQALRVLSDKNNYNYGTVMNAESVVKEFEDVNKENDLPF